MSMRNPVPHAINPVAGVALPPPPKKFLGGMLASRIVARNALRPGLRQFSCAGVAPIKRALISVSDKDGLVEVGTSLNPRAFSRCATKMQWVRAGTDMRVRCLLFVARSQFGQFLGSQGKLYVWQFSFCPECAAQLLLPSSSSCLRTCNAPLLAQPLVRIQSLKASTRPCLGVEILSTGGTAKLLRDAGVEVSPEACFHGQQ